MDKHTEFNDLGPTTRDLLVQLRRTISDGSQHAHFACGGSIPIVDASVKVHESGTTGEESITPSPPILLHWDSTNPKTLASQTKLMFPISVDNLGQLVSDVQPATFGLGGEDVYDESYRKASKLDPTAFTTSFNPRDLGIVDVITQVLLPSVDSSVGRGVHAELYKLNIYAGPSGMFKNHVDTPRSGTQFGSLVVCLPVAHEGGQLVVRHDKKEMTYDWSTTETNPDHGRLHWAAFYSDCEHEVKEVTSGYRVTLTYNLYAVPKDGRLAGNCSGLLDPVFLPLTHYVREMVVNPDFFPKGGHIGIPCTHAYPYTDPVLAPMPAVLKGIDMVVFEAFQSLGLTVRVRPVIPPGDPDLKEKGRIGSADKFHLWDSGYNNELYCYLTSRLRKAFEGREIKYAAVTWLTGLGKTEQMKHITYMAYGNEASVGAMYSHCAIIVEVPEIQSRVVMFPEIGDAEEMGEDAAEGKEEVLNDAISETSSTNYSDNDGSIEWDS